MHWPGSAAATEHEEQITVTRTGNESNCTEYSETASDHSQVNMLQASIAPKLPLEAKGGEQDSGYYWSLYI